MIIRAYRGSDLTGVVTCFNESVREIAPRYYTAGQIAAWAPADPDVTAWHHRLSTGGVFIADVSGVIAGFVRAESDGLIDLLYTHPEYERRGIGGSLLLTGCSWAAANGAKSFDSNVSLAARSLFETVGFCIEREQIIVHNGVSFQNYRMTCKHLLDLPHQ